MRPSVWDIVAVMGCAAVAYGAYMIAAPAGWIVGGVLALILGALGSNAGGRRHMGG